MLFIKICLLLFFWPEGRLKGREFFCLRGLSINWRLIGDLPLLLLKLIAKLIRRKPGSGKLYFCHDRHSMGLNYEEYGELCNKRGTFSLERCFLDEQISRSLILFDFP